MPTAITDGVDAATDSLAMAIAAHISAATTRSGRTDAVCRSLSSKNWVPTAIIRTIASVPMATNWAKISSSAPMWAPMIRKRRTKIWFPAMWMLNVISMRNARGTNRSSVIFASAIMGSVAMATTAISRKRTHVLLWVPNWVSVRCVT